MSPSVEEGYIYLETIEWTEQRLAHSVIIKLKKVPFKVKLFKLIAKNGDIDWVITNDLNETLTTQVVEVTNNLRWKVEEFHREFKQLTGSEQCQCRKAHSQHYHLGCCYHAWLSLKVYAERTNRANAI